MIVGVLGGGQLARMLAQAGKSLGLSFVFLSPEPDACAATLGEHLCADYEDETALANLAERSDVVTYEFENVPIQAVRSLSTRGPVHPSAEVLAVARDRMHEKDYFRALKIPTPEYAAVDSFDELQQAVAKIGLPAVLKTRTQGYDGKGQAVLRSPQDLAEVWTAWGNAPAIVEALIPFERELSIIAVRSSVGETAFYPLSENHHREGVLRLSLSRSGEAMQSLAESYIQRLLDDLGYVGVLALELFQAGDKLLANEIAPRVHNSGHWTIEGADTSQFENHLRAILGMPLGATSVRSPAAMVNLIGTLPDQDELLAVQGAVPHFYGKAERPGRKVGHVTLTSANCSPDEFDQRVSRLLTLANETELASHTFQN